MRRQKGGYWKRPVNRTYMYNLDVGEHYYSPMTSYLESERGTRGETPGAMTYDERLQRQWLYGRRYEPLEFRERYARASSAARGETSSSYLASEMASRNTRAASEMRASSAYSRQAAEQSLKASREEQMQKTTTIQQKKATMALSRQEMLAASTASTQQKSASTASASRTQVQTESKRKIEDDIIKKVADVRMSPWSKGQELDEANAASARARARILELEKELEEITRKAMTTQVKALKTAKQMAMEATREDEAAMASSIKKSKKVMIESSSKILA